MANVTRAEELVQTIEHDPSFQQDVEAAPTIAAKRDILDAHGFQDVSLDDMKAYVESQGGTLVVKQGDRELSDEELDAVVGGLTDVETALTVGGVLAGAVFVATAAAAA